MLSRALKILALAVLTPIAAQAQQVDNYPSRPVKIIVPWGVGGISDTLARKLGDELGKRLGQPFVVENRSGAAGNVGAAVVAKSRPDGYTLLLTADTNITVNPVVYDKLTYDPLKDLTPVAMLSNMPVLLVTHPSSKAATVSELVSQAKTSEPMTFGTSGPGSPASLLNELFKQRTGIEMNQIPYQGNAPSVASVVIGETKALFSATNGVMPFIQSGKLNALAVVSKSRWPLLPKVPTMHEAGIDGMDMEFWQLVLAPAGTPPRVIEKINANLAEITKQQDFIELVSALGMTPIGNASPEDTAKRIRDEHRAWLDLSKRVNLRGQ